MPGCGEGQVTSNGQSLSCSFQQEGLRSTHKGQSLRVCPCFQRFSLRKEQFGVRNNFQGTEKPGLVAKM